MEITDVYRTKENKTLVELDAAEIEKTGAELIQDDIIHIDEAGSIRHNELKTAYLVFSTLMR
jgi:hypothetical protein